ncbi:MAG: CvpA family protein [Candidatus Levybacteria bacterium]|nr:CvpA family protein [Candidatus Levybacteria bacterium]
MIPLEQFKEFLHFLSLPFVNLNFVDLAIILVVAVYAIEGYALGFIRGFADFISFVLSFLFGLTFYDIFGDFLVNSFNIPKGFGNALGFFLGAFICEVVLTLILRSWVLPFVLNRLEALKYPKEIEKLTGIIPGIFSAVVLLAFVLTMVVSLPLSPFLKNSVAASRLGEPLVSNIQGFDKQLNNIFGGAVNDALTFLTIEPKSEELLKLNFTTQNIKTDEASETEMFSSVNEERGKAGVEALEEDPSLRLVARNHCQDMLARGYFSHYTPEGKSPFDRMSENDIEFAFAGENLALAPSTKLAMQGLMNSPGHRENILSKNFGRAGIGVIDGGIYGEMFCQEFAD